MEINYSAFQTAISEENYEDAFYILFQMIDRLDPDAIKADRKWTRIARKKTDNQVIQDLDKKFRALPKKKKKEIQNKFESMEN